MEPNDWIRLVLSAVSGFADPEYQERVWVRGVGPEVGSPIEDYENLYSSFSFEEFIAEGVRSLGLSKDCVERLQRLDTVLRDYPLEKMMPEEILADPQWLSIVEGAKNAAQCLAEEADSVH